MAKNLEYREDGRYSATVPLRFPQEVYEAYSARARAEGVSVGQYLKSILMKLSGVTICYDGHGGIVENPRKGG